ncbi:3-hydroxyacyl-[acyl-carrier-protein] dehydratase FabZ [Trichinella spiralis]|uniref:3-hydroxyacyl-[acyl-carrier-protein] dehydratase FabZ n=1 Tax=Trichinella spiralis TaxID=6334 RepID=A0ABR3KPH7_TRISP
MHIYLHQLCTIFQLKLCVMENDVDEEIFKLLDCMNEQIHLKLILERKMKECWMAMAKARESMGSLLNISVVNLDSTTESRCSKSLDCLLQFIWHNLYKIWQK